MYDVKDCLVSFKTTQSVKLKVLFESLNAILGDALIDFTPDGVFLSASTANGIIVMNMLKENIEEYVCVQNVECGIKFSAMFAYLKTVTDTDVVGIQVTRDGFNGAGATSPSAYLFISNNGAEGKCDAYRSMYQIRLLVLERFEITQMMPEALHMDTCVTLPSTAFQRFLRAHEKVDASPDLDIQIMAHIPEPDADGNLPTQGDVYFVSDGQDAHLVTSSSFPIYRSTDDTSNVFMRPSLTSMFIDPDEKQPDLELPPDNTAPDNAEQDQQQQQQPENNTVAVPSATGSAVEDSVKFVIDSRFLKIETSIYYAHRSSDKKEQYSLKLLLEIAKMTGMSHSVRLFLAPDSPLAIVYDIGTLGSVLLFVAPRSEEVVNCDLKSVMPHSVHSGAQLGTVPTVSMRSLSKPEREDDVDPTTKASLFPGQKRARKPGAGRPKKKTKTVSDKAVTAAAAKGAPDDEPMDESVLENADGDELADHEVFRQVERGI